MNGRTEGGSYTGALSAAVEGSHLDVAGKRVTVMGLGRFGGGVGVTRWLAAQGSDVLLTDLDPAEKLTESLAEVQGLIDAGRVETRLGEHNVSDFTTCDVVVANPAVPKPWDNRFIRAAQAAGVPVTTEMRLLVERLPRRERVIGVTGTAGKSTTTAMIGHALRSLGEPVYVGGNIGGSLLIDVDHISEADWVVLELSSAMLYWLDAGVGFAGAAGWSPRVAVVTNIAANHIDWHGEFGHYAESKRVITKFQRAGDSVVMARDGGPAGSWKIGEGVRVSPVDVGGERAMKTVGRLRVPGVHNRVNAMVAAEAVVEALLGDEGKQGSGNGDSVRRQALAAMGTYGGLPHRLQYAGDFVVGGGAQRGRGVAYNDSKSTTPEAAALAVMALDDDPAIGASRVHLIAGGYDKKVDLSPMVSAAARCAGVYTIGATGAKLAGAVNEAAVSGGRGADRALFCETLQHAVAAARARMKNGDALLLSPGCASWDQYVNFEKRGEEFVRLVQ